MPLMVLVAAGALCAVGALFTLLVILDSMWPAARSPQEGPMMTLFAMVIAIVGVIGMLAALLMIFIIWPMR